MAKRGYRTSSPYSKRGAQGGGDHESHSPVSLLSFCSSSMTRVHVVFTSFLGGFVLFLDLLVGKPTSKSRFCKAHTIPSFPLLPEVGKVVFL